MLEDTLNLGVTKSQNSLHTFFMVTDWKIIDTVLCNKLILHILLFIYIYIFFMMNTLEKCAFGPR